MIYEVAEKITFYEEGKKWWRFPHIGQLELPDDFIFDRVSCLITLQAINNEEVRLAWAQGINPPTPKSFYFEKGNGPLLLLKEFIPNKNFKFFENDMDFL